MTAIARPSNISHDMPRFSELRANGRAFVAACHPTLPATALFACLEKVRAASTEHRDVWFDGNPPIPADNIPRPNVHLVVIAGKTMDLEDLIRGLAKSCEISPNVPKCLGTEVGPTQRLVYAEIQDRLKNQPGRERFAYDPQPPGFTITYATYKAWERFGIQKPHHFNDAGGPCGSYSADKIMTRKYLPYLSGDDICRLGCVVLWKLAVAEQVAIPMSGFSPTALSAIAEYTIVPTAPPYFAGLPQTRWLIDETFPAPQS